jgi:3-(3-hydroxy-phenyl)propionate hydroxylase
MLLDTCMSLSREHCDVLVVGAGPTGLAAAAILAKLGVRVRIVEKTTQRSDKSKALAVQAGTLECLAAAFGPTLVKKLIAAGWPTQAVNIHVDAMAPRRIVFQSIPSQYNYILILAQPETERILEEHLHSLGVDVERGIELTALEKSNEQVTCTLVGPDSSAPETVAAKFVVGADGAHSEVRHAIHSEFEGGAYPGDFILGDVVLKWPWSYGEVHTFVSERGVVAAFPLKGDRRYRLILVPKGAKAAPSPEISAADFQETLNELAFSQVQVESAAWLTRFRISHRMVRAFHQDRVCLAGDAAHIHSPAGGQGMNTGIQDALNLGYKLNAILRGGSMNLLHSYDRERMPVARSILRGTDFFSRLMLLPENPFTGFFRRHVFARIAGVPLVQSRMLRAISQVDIARREIAGYDS